MIKKGTYQTVRKMFGLTKFIPFTKDEKLRDIIKGKILNNPGVYVFTGVKGSKEDVLYIGMAGKVQHDGTFKSQGLSGRICNRQKNKSREDFLKDIINGENNQYDLVKIYWKETCEIDEKRCLSKGKFPCEVETEFISIFLRKNKKLPRYNGEF